MCLDRQQLVQIVRSESDLPGPTTYRIPNNEQTYVVTSQPNVFYRTTAPQQPNSAIRQALETSSGNWGKVYQLFHSTDKSRRCLLWELCLTNVYCLKGENHFEPQIVVGPKKFWFEWLYVILRPDKMLSGGIRIY